MNANAGPVHAGGARSVVTGGTLASWASFSTADRAAVTCYVTTPQRIELKQGGALSRSDTGGLNRSVGLYLSIDHLRGVSMRTDLQAFRSNAVWSPQALYLMMHVGAVSICLG